MPFEKGNKLGELADHTKHGMSKTRLYRCWADMKTRCNCKTNRFYHRYGGRGIKVCEEWATFEPFKDWALNNGYSDELTIDRIDNDGDYCPGNCQWSTQKEQAANKKHPTNKYGHKGIRVAKHANGKIYGYKAVTTVTGKEVYLGYSKSLQEAIKLQKEGEKNLLTGRQQTKEGQTHA